ncbi:uncharacterized protein MKZ38_009806 [Zalerion maritima]|uniref:Uncharacterized protein n=1 Tax=Zalerion maritima TaxID=339359 RepID=A0AAD5RYG6_9PEZI|nr:uncharacterized protein MKZ38_009806 [Zalerion maritima]
MEEFNLRLALMTAYEHQQYPVDNCPSAEHDFHHLDLVISGFQSQHNHFDAGGQSFILKAYPAVGPGTTLDLPGVPDLLDYLSRPAFQNVKEYPLRFFFMYQPGAANRVYHECMQQLMSLYTVNPSFPHLVGQSHISSFGSYVRRDQRGGPDQVPEPCAHESWWSISAPRAWRRGGSAEEVLKDPQYVKMFDLQNLERNMWALLIWRMSVCLQFDVKTQSCTVIALDWGLPGSSAYRKFDMAMDRRGELYVTEDPFAVHAMFLSQVVQDWTFSFEVLEREYKEEEEVAFARNLDPAEIRKVSRRLHSLVAYQLKHQNHLVMTPKVIEQVQYEHRRFREIANIPDHAFDRVENLFRRLKTQAESNYQHSLRMENQASNMQERLNDLASLEVSAEISRNSKAVADNTETVDRLIKTVNDALPGYGLGSRAAVPATAPGGGEPSNGTALATVPPWSFTGPAASSTTRNIPLPLDNGHGPNHPVAAKSPDGGSRPYMEGWVELLTTGRSLSVTSTATLSRLEALGRTAEDHRISLEGIATNSAVSLELVSQSNERLEELARTAESHRWALNELAETSKKSLAAVRRSNDLSAAALDQIQATGETSRDTILELRKLARDAENQRYYLQNLETLNFWTHPMTMISGLVSMGIIVFQQRENSSSNGLVKRGEWVLVAYVVFMAVFVGYFAWYGLGSGLGELFRGPMVKRHKSEVATVEEGAGTGDGDGNRNRDGPTNREAPATTVSVGGLAEEMFTEPRQTTPHVQELGNSGGGTATRNFVDITAGEEGAFEMRDMSTEQHEDRHPGP